MSSHRPQHDPSQKRRLTIDPGLASVAAAAIVAVGGLVGVLVGRATSHGTSTPRPTVTVTVMAPAPNRGGSSGGTSTPAPTGPSASAQSAIRWGPGLIRVDSVQLDSIPPESGAGGGGDVGYYSNNSDPGIFGILSTKVAPWKGSTEPGESQCTSLVETQGVAGAGGFIPVQKGSIVCTITDEGRTARLKVTTVNVEQSYVMAEVTVWQEPS